MEKPSSTSPASKKWVIWALALGLPAVLLAFTGLAVAGPMAADFTPTVFLYFPLVVMLPTPTPTNTPIPSPTPIWTATPTQPPAPPGGSTRVSGNVYLRDNKPTYATWCENVWFEDWIHNDDGALSLNWTILGVSLVGPGMNTFHTSWSNQTSWFTIYPNCFGPGGMPCAGSSGAGQWLDAVSGPGHGDTLITNPGNYTLTEAVCLSSYGTCRGGGGWRTFNSVTFTTVNWGTPQQCPHTSAQEMPGTPADPLAGCHLDMSDPQNVRMVCPSK